MNALVSLDISVPQDLEPSTVLEVLHGFVQTRQLGDVIHSQTTDPDSDLLVKDES